ncbi:MAG: DNA polymerase III, partial [Lachnospiraceae bacterium]|nr:DNA polymerase III [Lachnospiraceae bacterium]
ALIKKKETLEHISYDNFIAPPDKQHEVRVKFSDYEKYITRTFATREAMLSDKEIKNVNCYLCDKPSKKHTKLFSPTGKYYLCIAYCEEHGYIKTKIRVRKNDVGRFFAVKTKKAVSAEDAESIISRYKKLKEDKHQGKSTK